jgi:hypothetical protein
MALDCICLDFDGVLAIHGRWTTPVEVHRDLHPDALLWVTRMLEHWRIAVHSCRSETGAGREAMRAWLGLHGFPVDRMEFPESKPLAMLYIDDRGLRFEGIFPELAPGEQRYPWDLKKRIAVRQQLRAAQARLGRARGSR